LAGPARLLECADLCRHVDAKDPSQRHHGEDDPDDAEGIRHRVADGGVRSGRTDAGEGLLGGLLLGAGFVLLRDALDNTLKDADDVERHLHLELLASIPRYGKDDATLATEAYQNLRTALLFSRRGDEGQVVLVTGTAPGEGKTTTLLNVAKLLAVSGESVVVLDCDLRRANLHLRLNVPREPGFTDFFVKGQDYLRAAELFESVGQLAEAAASFEAGESWAQAGGVYARAGLKDRAAAAFEKARPWQQTRPALD